MLRWVGYLNHFLMGCVGPRSTPIYIGIYAFYSLKTAKSWLLFNFFENSDKLFLKVFYLKNDWFKKKKSHLGCTSPYTLTWKYPLPSCTTPCMIKLYQYFLHTNHFHAITMCKWVWSQNWSQMLNDLDALCFWRYCFPLTLSLVLLYTG